MTTRSLEQDYLEWLSGQIRPTHRRRDRTYQDLIDLLWQKEFVWFIPNDDNRIADGLDLRVEFQREVLPSNTRIELGNLGCSVLEVIIGIARRAAFATEGEADIWAWVLLENLHLDKMYDPISRAKADRIDEILENFIWRQYGKDGEGGLFPLTFPEQDQTKVEIWYQMNAYVCELPPH